MGAGHRLGNAWIARPVATRRRVGGARRRGKLAAEAAPTREESSRASSRGCVTCGLLRGGLRGVRGRCRFGRRRLGFGGVGRSEEHTSELQSLMRISYAVFCLKKKK